jgi:hypothetical protein
MNAEERESTEPDTEQRADEGSTDEAKAEASLRSYVRRTLRDRRRHRRKGLKYKGPQRRYHDRRKKKDRRAGAEWP